VKESQRGLEKGMGIYESPEGKIANRSKELKRGK